ncbi:serine/threonine-protein kinase [Pirellula sp. SH-Sr6A]|uniref:serine/threonine-protein kinase n=1 Tax=Pirellula sp. SH-Sr6A TaxID=1632865 RepID=UPI0011BA57C0|nr:serine/threonine-protein kinase [Pirellula sp. SH-Sr6A]
MPCRFGDYVLEKVLGRGGMGVVYLATQSNLSRQVAVKMIRSGALASDDEVIRFYAEARSAGSLMHPSIITIYHCGEHEGHHFFSMDYVPGTDLAKKLSEGPMNVREAVRYVRDVARAIDYAHSQGVVHRDLKPANVLITQDDEVVLTDFGLAKRIGADEGLTATGAALGTPSYMSPEQAAGKSEEQGASTDVYAMGAILYALLVGKPPFQAETVLQTMMQVMNRPAPSVRLSRPDVHPDLDTIVMKCLEKTPSRRYATARELADDLERFYQGSPISARPPSMWRQAKYWLSNVPIIAALSGSRNVEPTRSQRMTQNIVLFLLFAGLVTWLVGPRMLEVVHDNTLPRRVTIASGSPGGMYFQFAGQISAEIERETGLHPNVIPTNGSLDNLKQLQDGKVHLAIMQESAVRSDQVAVVAPLFYEAVHILVRKELGIRRIEDIASRRVMLGSKASGTRQAAIRLISHFDMDVDELSTIDGDWFQEDLRRQAEVVVVVVKVGQQGVRDMLHAEGFEMLPISNAATLALEEPMFRPYEIPMKDYGLDGAGSVQTLATTALLVVRRDAPSRLVSESLQAIYHQSPAGASISGLIPLELAVNWQGLPYHEAARRFYQQYER